MTISLTNHQPPYLDNPVNQQIAIKFIESLDFSVTAVWNGKEALEYLLKASSPRHGPAEDASLKLPSLILMDVQMPILDGYRTTHMLRHHAPFMSIEALKRIPIVAMTASAIQGDREKCERAGMDDYLAKPVKRPILEKMITKWIELEPDKRQSSITGVRKPTLSRAGTDHSSNCPEHDEIVASFMATDVLWNPPYLDRDATTSAVTQPQPGAHSTLRNNRRASISGSYLNSRMGGDESEGDRAMRRAEAEDKARFLRDAKLLSATDSEPGTTPAAVGISRINISRSFSDSRDHVPQSYPTQGMSDLAGGVSALTEANVHRHNHEIVGGRGDMMPADLPGPPPDFAVAKIDIPESELIPVWSKTKASEPAMGQSKDSARPRLTEGKSSDKSVSTAKP